MYVLQSVHIIKIEAYAKTLPTHMHTRPGKNGKSFALTPIIVAGCQLAIHMYVAPSTIPQALSLKTPRFIVPQLLCHAHKLRRRISVAAINKRRLLSTPNGGQTDLHTCSTRTQICTYIHMYEYDTYVPHDQPV